MIAGREVGETMTSSRGERVRARRAVYRARRLWVFGSLAAVIVLAAGGVFTAMALAQSAGSGPTAQAEPAASESATPIPEETPLTPAQTLLASSTDPQACAVQFTGDAIAQDPVLQTQGALYSGLPIPRAEGKVFAGWYASDADAAALTAAARVNGSDAVSCVDRQVTLHGAWTTPDVNAAEDAGIPILMYHQFTANPEGENNSLKLNYAYIGDFDAQMAYIASSGFYLPTWDELSAFIDGALFLPEHSVIVTDDDAHQTWLELAAPVVEKYKVMTTSFVITKWRTEGTPNPYVLQRSHTQDMHEAGENGKGRMVNWTADQIAADLEQSAQILGAKEVVAYPFGHYNDTTKQGVAQAGFEMGRTIEQGYVRIGTDKLALPCIRINYGMTVDDLAGLIG